MACQGCKRVLDSQIDASDAGRRQIVNAQVHDGLGVQR
jgi:hypothetical protein